LGKRLGLVLAGLAFTLSTPAQAQFSAGFKFLEAVRKKDGAKVEAALNEPGSTIINTRDVTTGKGALHYVAERRDEQWLRYLIGKGANVNPRDNRGATPLQIASAMGWTPGVAILVESGARVDDATDTGETALISAVHLRDIQMMRLLLKAGADPDRKDNSGRSARDYALIEGENSSVMAEIRANAKPAASRAGGAKVYGPTF